MVESDGSNNSFVDSINEEVVLMFKNFKQIMKKKRNFQHSSKRKGTRFKKKYKE